MNRKFEEITQSVTRKHQERKNIEDVKKLQGENEVGQCMKLPEKKEQRELEEALLKAIGTKNFSELISKTQRRTNGKQMKIKAINKSIGNS